jgi:type VI secretion system protein ImpH
MASASWGTDRSIAELLYAAAFEFDFFQAVRLLARLREELKPVGAAAAPHSEVVRFRARNSLAFAASAVHSIEEDHGGPPYMTVAFMGLTGPKGTLPTHYTEIAMEREAAGETALSEFLDIFNHRLISLFYRAWEKHHFTIGYESAQRTASKDAFTGYLHALIGMGTSGLSGRLPFRDDALIRYAGLFAQRPNSASALEGILQDYFGVPVEIEQFRPSRHRLEEQDLCRPGPRETISNQLGMGAVAGDAVWNTHGSFQVRIGPLTLKRFRQFLPDGEAFRQATALIRLFAERALEFEIQPVLKADEVPLCELTRDPREGPRLGWTGWLKVKEFKQDADDATFRGKG